MRKIISILTYPSEKILIGLAVALIIFLVILIGDLTFITSQQSISGQVIEMQYVPSSSSVGIGIVSNESQPGLVVASSSKSEKWSIVLKLSEGYKTIDVPADVYYTLSIGGMAHLSCKVGLLFGSINSCRLDK